MPRTTLVLSLFPAAVGCSPTICTTELRPGLIVTIVDSVSGEPRAGPASGSAQEASFTDPLQPFGFEGGTMISRKAADERPGTYSLTVTAPGYVTWQRAGVRVEGGDCHVKTAEITARLQTPP